MIWSPSVSNVMITSLNYIWLKNSDLLIENSFFIEKNHQTIFFLRSKYYFKWYIWNFSTLRNCVLTKYKFHLNDVSDQYISTRSHNHQNWWLAHPKNCHHHHHQHNHWKLRFSVVKIDHKLFFDPNIYTWPSSCPFYYIIIIKNIKSCNPTSSFYSDIAWP